MLQIDRIYYPVETLGYGKRIGIWTIGCPRRCNNCSNPELWEEDESKDVSIDRIISVIKSIDGADGITITGGDPFFQDKELCNLLRMTSSMGYSDVLVYTGYTLNEICGLSDYAKESLGYIGVLVDGPYIDALNDGKSFRGSSNQMIHILNQELNERYKGADSWERRTQIVMKDNRIQAIGVPIRQ